MSTEDRSALLARSLLPFSTRLDAGDQAKLLSRVLELIERATQEERQRCVHHCEARMKLWSNSAQARSELPAARQEARARANEAEYLRDLIEASVTPDRGRS